jgi:hypothetical protein
MERIVVIIIIRSSRVDGWPRKTLPERGPHQLSWMILLSWSFFSSHFDDDDDGDDERTSGRDSCRAVVLSARSPIHNTHTHFIFLPLALSRSHSFL